VASSAVRTRRWPYLVQHYGDLSFEAHPGACAIRSRRDGSLEYEELYRRSNRLAHGLRAAGVGREARVALCLQRSATTIVAMLGVLKADAAYVPIHERSPIARCRAVLEDCRPDAVIADQHTLDLVLQAQGAVGPHSPLVLLGQGAGGPIPADRLVLSQDQIDAQPDTPPRCANIDTDIAYILYTSGSTGRPKGVMISHLNIVNYVEWATEYFGLHQRDRILGTAPFHFDMSTFDVFCAQKAGAALCIAMEDDTLFPARLVQLMEQEGVTLWKGVASLLAYMARTGAIQPGRLPSLRMVLFSGERLPTKALARWMATFPEKRFYNVYGPTEATGISTVYALEGPPEDPAVNVPIGRPCANTEVLVLTEDGQLAETDQVGEICIRGSGLSRGYWNDSEKTQRAFVASPISRFPQDRLYRTGDLGFWGPDGQLRLVGRLDEQVKWMGYRIELGEIALSIQAQAGVDDAIVMLLPGRDGEMEELVAFVVLAEGGEPASVLSTLRRQLPPYMIPKRVVAVEVMPRSDRGKVDREGLRRLYSS
jgi:D-alanine--poly(phosphoribitol) ligase subunit 1